MRLAIAVTTALLLAGTLPVSAQPRTKSRPGSTRLLMGGIRHQSNQTRLPKLAIQHLTQSLVRKGQISLAQMQVLQQLGMPVTGLGFSGNTVVYRTAKYETRFDASAVRCFGRPEAEQIFEANLAYQSAKKTKNNSLALAAFAGSLRSGSKTVDQPRPAAALETRTQSPSLLGIARTLQNPRSIRLVGNSIGFKARPNARAGMLEIAGAGGSIFVGAKGEMVFEPYVRRTIGFKPAGRGQL